ncbi:MAG TPA: VOC family protein [Pseudonocardia sp.]|jgi:catechol 2,3-dioxygenase-like lactoylglutathione lyase family enzyme|uniref:VOC family protein n=1 Tax=Pseudonocardia sp. TaxID=60912 RepID=UPI002F3EB008
MSIDFNHTIVNCRDREQSAAFVAGILGLPVGEPLGPFLPVQTANEVSLDFVQSGEPDPPPQHYAFLVTESEFDAIFARIKDQRVPYAADYAYQEMGQINHNDGGRGLYFQDPSRHSYEVITRPYGPDTFS